MIIGRQGVLLDAAVKAGVPRFIPSDHSGMRWTSVPQHLSGLRETKGRDDQPGA